MLKITIHDAAGQRRLELEGRLAGVWVSELEHCWRTAQASHPNRTLAVDLTSVTFIDQAGRYLLRLMHRNGVRFVASDLMLQDILDHVTGMIE
jgi:anti-anti-sigma regulatory factor